MPRSLFLKIFLWFGTVVVTVIVGTFLVGEFMRPEASGPPQRRAFDFQLSGYAQTAAEIYERDGQPALVGYLERLQRESNIHAFLFNDQLQELTGQRIPEGAPGLARRALETRLPEFGGNGPVPLAVRPALTARGGQYALVAEMPHRGPPPHWYDHALHVLLMTLIGAAFCAWLAKYLTSPVAKLRAATQELAQGNLSARVGPAMGNRRDELASLGADFDLMAEQIESLLNAQRRLLGDISHELRSPLARLNVALELARQRAGQGAKTALDRIHREAENLNEMIGQLLALTRLESGAEGLKKTEFDLAQLVRDIADDANFEARSRKRAVRLETPEHCNIVGTEQLLRRAIENVVRNAVQYTAEETEVEVKLECLETTNLEDSNNRDLNTKDKSQSSKFSESRFEAASDQRLAVITIRDHGVGVPENALGKIFHPFYRVDDARDREAGGVGLGLAIAERAVKLHGGSVKAANAQGGGLIVTITMPVNSKQ